MALTAVIFDMDGVIVDSEPQWAEAKKAVSDAAGGRWRASAPEEMLGMSAGEWSAFMRNELGVQLDVREINSRVVAGVIERLEAGLPLLSGAVDCVRRLAGRWPLGVASSADRPVIEHVLRTAGIEDCFRAVVSSGDVGAGKPAPDVYLAAAERLGAGPASCAAIEDSLNGLRSASAAGMLALGVANRHTDRRAQEAIADMVVDSLDALTPKLLESAAAHS